MEPGKLSFIPKSSSLKTSYKTIYKEAGLGLIMKASAFLFILSLAGFGGAYLYKEAAIREIDELTTSLERAKAAFDPALISEMERLMLSVSSAKDVLDKHRYPSNLFDVIEGLVHEKVTFASFGYDYTFPGSKAQGVDQGLRIFLSGEAESYRVLAEQSEIFENSEEVKYFSYSNFALDESGKVSFSLDIAVDSAILFREPPDILSVF